MNIINPRNACGVVESFDEYEYNIRDNFDITSAIKFRNDINNSMYAHRRGMFKVERVARGTLWRATIMFDKVCGSFVHPELFSSDIEAIDAMKKLGPFLVHETVEWFDNIHRNFTSSLSEGGDYAC